MISRDRWIEVIKDFQEMEMPRIIPRDIDIPLETPIRRSISIIGPRRCGKTYEMFYLISLLTEKYGRSKILYVNFEDPSLTGATLEDLIRMRKVFYEMYPENVGKKVWFFLDEIHNVENWEKFVRKCLDDNLNVFITGSSSKLLSREIATQLRGRNLSYYLYPFSFREFLKARNMNVSKYLSSSDKIKIMNALRKYISGGGYPEAVLYEKERERILKEIFEVTIYRDVIERINARNIKAVKLLSSALVNSSYFSVHKFYNFLKSRGIKISKNTLYSYFDAFVDALVVLPLFRLDFSYRKVEQSIPKIYFVDNGLLSVNGIDDAGRLMENAVAAELFRRGEEISYVKNHNFEVDFAVKKGKTVKQLIQVCYDIENFTTRERELKALREVSKLLKCKDLLVVTWDYEAEEEVKGRKIKFVPLWKWLVKF